MTLRKDDFLSDEQRRHAIQEIIRYVATERDEKLGVITAEEILDFFLQDIGGAIYNHAPDQTRPFLEEKFEETLMDLDVTYRKEAKKPC